MMMNSGFFMAAASLLQMKTSVSTWILKRENQ